MAIVRVLSAVILSATTGISLSAQTTFSAKYTAFKTDPSFTEPPPQELLQADLNGDGVPDFIAAQGQQELLSNTSGGYTLHTLPLPFGEAMPLVAGDFNGDGKNDVLFYAYAGGSNLFLVGYGDGAGNFPSSKSITNLPGVTSGNFSDVVATATDVNGDGRTDLVLANLDLSSGTPIVNVYLYLNNGSGFTDKGKIYSDAGPATDTEYYQGIQLLLGDYDSDGHADIAVSAAHLTVLYGNGAGAFTAKTIFTNTSQANFAAADINDDGRTDLVGIGSDKVAHILRSQPGRVFSSSTLTVPSAQAFYIYPPVLADFDGDGRKDIGFVAPSSDYSQYGFNAVYQTSTGTWKPGTFTPVDTFSSYYGMIPFLGFNVGNYNRDGKADISFFTDNSAAANHPNSADLLLNAGTRPVGACAPPAIGIRVCSPGSSSASPVRFSFSATSFYPLRKMEVWVDGVKKSETHHVFANQGFSDVSLALPAGTHTVSFFAGTYDGHVTKKTISVSVP